MPVDLDFTESPLPNQKFDLIDCNYVLRYLLRKWGDATLARAFLMQLFKSLNVGGALVVNNDDNNFELPFSDEELTQLGIQCQTVEHAEVGNVWGLDRPVPPRIINYQIFTKVSETPLLKEINREIKLAYPQRQPVPVRVSSFKPNVVGATLPPTPEQHWLRQPSAVAHHTPTQSPTHFAALLENAGLNVDEYADILEPDAFEMLKSEGQLEGLVASLREGDEAAFNTQMAEIENTVYETPRRLNYSVHSGMQRTALAPLARL